MSDLHNDDSGAPGPRKGRRWPTLVAVLAIAGGGAVWLAERDERKPTAVDLNLPARHVIVISLDTTRADHLHCYGNEWIKTPNFDAFSRESIRFSDCMTVAPTTLASHTSLFTGKYPHTHGTPRNGFMVNPDNRMLAEVLSEYGFKTAGFLASFALESRFDFAQGFDFFDETFDQLVGDGGADQSQRDAKAVTDAVINYLDTEGVPDNLFLFVHYFDPHAPYDPPIEYEKLYNPNAADRMDYKEVLTAWRKTSPGAENRFSRILDARYAGEVTYMDEHVGRLLKDLEQRGMYDDALVIIVSDHGESLWRHRPFYDHGWHVFDSTVRAVCMIHLPGGANGGAHINDLVANIDIMPSVLSFLGLPLPEGMEGAAIDLAGAKVPDAPRVRFSEATKPWEKVERGQKWYNNLKAKCVRSGRYKFISEPYRETEAMYDLDADPYEHHDLLLDPTPEILARADEMRRALKAWSDSADPLPTEFEKEQQQETIRRLKSLGYLGGN